MGKKEKERNKRSKTTKSMDAKKWVPYLLVAIIGLVGGYYLFPSGSNKGKILSPSQLKGGETRPVLSPAYFVGQTAKAYRVAREIPQVLDSIYCYCQCERTIGHKSLLSCYTDEHAAYCAICQDQALRAYELYKEGKDIISIRKTIDDEFGA